MEALRVAEADIEWILGKPDNYLKNKRKERLLKVPYECCGRLYHDSPGANQRSPRPELIGISLPGRV
jgi:hypothetical protein